MVAVNSKVDEMKGRIDSIRRTIIMYFFDDNEEAAGDLNVTGLLCCVSMAMRAYREQITKLKSENEMLRKALAKADGPAGGGA